MSNEAAADQIRDWRAALRRIFDESFAYDWTAHLNELNERNRFEGDRRLSGTAIGMPPVWFNGNIEAIEPGGWVFVISLNPSLAREGEHDHVREREQWWRLWLEFNRDHWYPTFFRPIVRLAVAAIGEPVPEVEYPDFATDRMIFVELCPYASHEFSIEREILAELVESDRGFRVAEEVASILVREAKPALILVNGASAMEHFERRHARDLRWTMRSYTSPDRKDVMLRHREGYHTGTAEIPVLGFPFLRTPRSHNTTAELAELARRARAFVSGGARDAQPPARSANEPAETHAARSFHNTTRFDVTVDGATRARLHKNHAIHAVVSALCRSGVAPNEIQRIIGRATDRLFAASPGLLDSNEFVDVQKRAAAAGGRAFEPRRWFCASGQLIHINGQTIAFSTQWGLDTEATIERLLAAFPGRGIAVRPHAQTRAPEP